MSRIKNFLLSIFKKKLRHALSLEPAEDRPGIIIHRLAREVGDDWDQARSWFGGAPKLCGQPWPIGKNGKPLHFVAQLDLSDIHTACGPSELPHRGSLAFFLNAEDGCGECEPAVLYFPHGATGNFSVAPAGQVELEEVGFDFPGIDCQMPRWPVGFFSVPVSDYHAEQAAVEARLNHYKDVLTARAAFAGLPIPRWWQTAIYYAEFLKKQLAAAPSCIETHELRIAEIDAFLADPDAHPPELLAARRDLREYYLNDILTIVQHSEQIAPFIAELAGWCAQRDPWSEMSDSDWALLDSYWGRKPDYSGVTQSRGRTDIDNLSEEMFRALPQEGTSAFDALPDAVHAIIRARCAPHPQWWHTAQLILAALDRAAANNAAAASSSDFQFFYQEVLHWIHPNATERNNRDPWSQMEPEDATKLIDVYHRCKSEFRELMDYTVPCEIDGSQYVQTIHNAIYNLDGLHDFETVTLYRLLTGSSEAYATLPQATRDLVNRDHLLPSTLHHQMFGNFTQIQSNAYLDNIDRFMLFQISYDYPLFWNFNCGVFQFWILPADLRAKNFKNVNLTFECT